MVDPSGLRYAENFEGYGVATAVEPVWNDVTLRIGLSGAAGQWQAERHVAGSWQVGQQQQLSLNCDFGSTPAGSNAV